MRAEGAETDGRRVAACSEGCRGSGDGRLLLVDGDDELRLLLASGFRQEGLVVTEAADGRAALDALSALEPQVVLADVVLRGIDGHELCRRIRSEAGEDVAVLLCSTRHEAVDRIESLRAGADDHVVKPLSFEELLLRVRGHLRRASARRSSGAGDRLLSGRLEEFSPAEVLQMLELRGRGDVVVRFRGPAGEGARVYVHDRQLLHVELGALEGPKAFSRLLAWDEGTFVVEREPFEGVPTMASSLDRALLTSLVTLDEQRNLWSELERGVRYRPADVPRGLGVRQRQLLSLAASHGALQAILDASPYSDVDTLRIVRELVRGGALVAEGVR